ncbi:hypothetical protein FVE85_4989 [Porphyridium purpureum]|uniref:Protein kinase domain-containing protein n=1 Tax=Porphyridium purpureum TaxID=35688 RepID=A0A5J4YSM1_PORPP|nr:hypothetical protein FVE85_4989 [Porphyridium purpureum]|eukprot:POR9770..scf236_6
MESDWCTSMTSARTAPRSGLGEWSHHAESGSLAWVPAAAWLPERVSAHSQCQRCGSCEVSRGVEVAPGRFSALGACARHYPRSRGRARPRVRMAWLRSVSMCSEISDGQSADATRVLVPSGACLRSSSGMTYELTAPLLGTAKQVVTAQCEQGAVILEVVRLGSASAKLTNEVPVSSGLSASWEDVEHLERTAQLLQSLTMHHQACADFLVCHVDHGSLDTSAEGNGILFFLAYRPSAKTALESFVSLQDLRLRQSWRASAAIVHRMLELLLQALREFSSLSPPVLMGCTDCYGGDESQHGLRLLHPSAVLLARTEDAADLQISLRPLLRGTMGDIDSYMAPELRMRLHPSDGTTQSDLYAIGALMVFVLTGKHPDPELLSRPQIWRALLPNASSSRLKRVFDLTEWMLRPRPMDRPADADMALAFLEGSLESVPGTPALSGTTAAPISPRDAAERISTSNSVSLSSIREAPSRHLCISQPDSARAEVLISKNGLNVESVAMAASAVGWNAIVGAWTVSAISSGGLIALFSVPFWFAGVQMASRTFSAITKESALVLDRAANSFALYNALEMNRSSLVWSGALTDVVNVQLGTRDNAIGEGVELAFTATGVKGARSCRIGTTLPLDDQRKLFVFLSEFLGVGDLGQVRENVALQEARAREREASSAFDDDSDWDRR